MKLMDARKKEIENINNKFCIIYDNASIHKTKAIQRFAIINRLSILTIPPYCPVLNAAEKLILSIKKKIVKYNDEGRRTTFSLVAKVADDISKTDLKGYVDASFKESYEYLIQHSD